MARKTLSYREITNAAEDEILWLAKYCFKNNADKERFLSEWSQGVGLLWRRLVMRLAHKGDSASQEEMDNDPEFKRFEALFSETLEKLREEAEQADPQTNSK